MESEICSKFAKIGTTNPSFKTKIDQNSDEGTENATKTFLNYVNISKLNIWLLYFCLILVNFGILSMTEQTRCLCVIGYLSRFEIKCPFISCTLLLKLMCILLNIKTKGCKPYQIKPWIQFLTQTTKTKWFKRLEFCFHFLFRCM